MLQTEPQLSISMLMFSNKVKVEVGFRFTTSTGYFVIEGEKIIIVSNQGATL